MLGNWAAERLVASSEGLSCMQLVTGVSLKRILRMVVRRVQICSAAEFPEEGWEKVQCCTNIGVTYRSITKGVFSWSSKKDNKLLRYVAWIPEVNWKPLYHFWIKCDVVLGQLLRFVSLSGRSLGSNEITHRRASSARDWCYPDARVEG
jgi:hypothetical protein